MTSIINAPLWAWLLVMLCSALIGVVVFSFVLDMRRHSRQKDANAAAEQRLTSTVVDTVPASVSDMKHPHSEVGPTKARPEDLEPFTVFKTSRGEGLPLQTTWGALPMEEIPPMFLDQFLIRYFFEIMRLPDLKLMQTSPWRAFVATNTWAKDLPMLFWQLTSYKLSERQMNQAIEEYVERMGKLAQGSAAHG